MDHQQHQHQGHRDPKIQKRSQVEYNAPLDSPAIYFGALVFAIMLFYFDQSYDVAAKLNHWLSFSPSLADLLIKMHAWTHALHGNNLIVICILVTIAVFGVTNFSLQRISAVGDAIASRISRTYAQKVSAKQFGDEKGEFT